MFIHDFFYDHVATDVQLFHILYSYSCAFSLDYANEYTES